MNYELNMKQKLISVVIPVYNTEKYLERCLQSVLGQTYSNTEIICVNDGSTDSSGNILEKYAATDKRIKIIEQKNQGQSAARNKAIKKASGDYIFFVDADDFIHPQTLEILLTAALKTKTSIVATDDAENYCSNVIDMQKLRYEIHQNPLLHILQNEASGSVIWNKLYKRELIKNRPFINGIYFEDWPWITCLFANIKIYTTVPYALYGYNRENVSTMRSGFTIRKINDFAVGINAVAEYFNRPQYQHLWPTVRKIRIGASLKHLINAVYHNRNQQKQLDEFLFLKLKELHEKGCFCYHELRFKVLLRLVKIWLRNRGK